MTGSVQSGLRTGVFRPEKDMNFYENHSMPGSSALRLAKQPKLLGGIICPLSLVDIGLTDLPKSGGGGCPSLLTTHPISLVLDGSGIFSILN